MSIPRAALGIPALVAAALMLAAQVVLAGMPEAETALERIRLAPDAWSAAHILIAAALVFFVLAGVALLTRTLAAIAAFTVLCVGVVAAAMTNGVDTVLGVLSGIGADGSIHRAIAESLVQPLDVWDFALTVGLVALVALLHLHETVPWWGSTAALIGLAVPAFGDLRVIAAAAVVAGFAALAASYLRPADGSPLWASIAIAVAFVPAAFFSVERAVLLVVVVAVLAAGRLASRQTEDRKLAAL